MITLVQSKGGVGKTSTCVLLADHFRHNTDEETPKEWGLITNDTSDLSLLFGKDYFVQVETMSDCPRGIGGADSVLIDLAGRPDQNSERVISDSGCVLIPVLPDRLSIEAGEYVASELWEVNDNIAVVAAMTTKEEKDQIETRFQKNFPDLKVFRLRRSNKPQAIIGKQKWSGVQIEETPILRYSWRGISDDIGFLADWTKEVS